jgi:DNA polymerase I-like protein with 3'-5' exonuclease and polymerase domains
MNDALNILVLDFESYYDSQYSLRTMTIPEYVHDPRFHVHGLALCRPGGQPEFRADANAALDELRQEFGQRLEKTTVVCHNAYFDLYILAKRYDLHPQHFFDTMLLAYHVHGRKERGHGASASLEALAEHFGLESKGDLEFMAGVRNPNPQQSAELAEYARRDVQITAGLAAELLTLISRPEVELPVIQHTVRLFTERGIRVDVDGIAAIEQAVRTDTTTALDAASTTADQISKNLKFTEMLTVALARTGRSIPLKPGKNGMIPATARKDEAMQALLDDDDPVVAALANARINQKAEDQKLARLATLRRIASATGCILPPYLVYYGSHTGRFAGGGGFNIQNLGRSGLGLQIRQLLRPQPGHVFVIGDLAQIEARVTAWLAGQGDMLDAFRRREDIYSLFASRTFGTEVHKPTAADPPETRPQLDALRTVGKSAVLGLGFGMGALKFMNTLRAEPKIALLFVQGRLTPSICREIVQTFRHTYPRIPEFWQALEAAARHAVHGTREEVARITAERDGNTIKLWLPSGRALRYAGLREESTQREITFLNEAGQEDRFTPEGDALVYGKDTPLYGGKLCENVVQATARDLLVEAVLRLEAQGFPVLFHVHDEVIVEVTESQVEKAKVAVTDALTRVPGWAPELPIDCEIKVSDRYGK